AAARWLSPGHDVAATMTIESHATLIFMQPPALGSPVEALLPPGPSPQGQPEAALPADRLSDEDEARPERNGQDVQDRADQPVRVMGRANEDVEPDESEDPHQHPSQRRHQPSGEPTHPHTAHGERPQALSSGRVASMASRAARMASTEFA